MLIPLGLELGLQHKAANQVYLDENKAFLTLDPSIICVREVVWVNFGRRIWSLIAVAQSWLTPLSDTDLLNNFKQLYLP